MDIGHRSTDRHRVEVNVAGETAVGKFTALRDQPSRSHEKRVLLGLGADQHLDGLRLAGNQFPGQVERAARIVEFAGLTAVDVNFGAALNQVDIHLDPLSAPVGGNRHSAAIPGAVQLRRLELAEKQRIEIEILIAGHRFRPDAGNLEIAPAAALRGNLVDAFSRKNRTELPEAVERNLFAAGRLDFPGVFETPELRIAAAVRRSLVEVDVLILVDRLDHHILKLHLAGGAEVGEAEIERLGALGDVEVSVAVDPVGGAGSVEHVRPRTDAVFPVGETHRQTSVPPSSAAGFDIGAAHLHGDPDQLVLGTDRDRGHQLDIAAFHRNIDLAVLHADRSARLVGEQSAQRFSGGRIEQQIRLRHLRQPFEFHVKKLRLAALSEDRGFEMNVSRPGRNHIDARTVDPIRRPFCGEDVRPRTDLLPGVVGENHRQPGVLPRLLAGNDVGGAQFERQRERLELRIELDRPADVLHAVDRNIEFAIPGLDGHTIHLRPAGGVAGGREQKIAALRPEHRTGGKHRRAQEFPHEHPFCVSVKKTVD